MMLVLSRKLGEEIVIGDNVRLTVVEICGNRVRLGVTAPAEISVRRTELCRSLDESGAEPAPGRSPTESACPGGRPGRAG
jgi:carbon storage regulator